MLHDPKTEQRTKVRLALVDAREWYDRHGIREDGKWEMCADLVIAHHAMRDDRLYAAACDKFTEANGLSPPVYYPTKAAIWKWHDTPGRTKAEVLAAFDKAIAAS